MLIAATVVAASVYVNAEGLNFEVCHGNYSGTDLPYRKAVCNSDGDGKFALVIYLHGGSSKGNDNAKQMDEKGIDSIANFIVRHHRKAVFIVPRCLWREIPANASLTMLQKHRFSPLWALPTGL